MALPSNLFNGFDSGKSGDLRLTGVPASFFTRLLPSINNLSELKVVLYILYLAGQKRGEPKWVGYWELARNEELLEGLKRPGDPRPTVELLREGLELAVTRGSLLRLMVAPAPNDFAEGNDFEPLTEPSAVTWFLLNTSGNRTFIADLESGKVALENTNLVSGIDFPEWNTASNASYDSVEGARNAINRWQEVRLQSARPDVYTLYEQNIGVLTPMLSERLGEATKLYPIEWLEDAFQQAVTYNRRNWAYISRILENWATEGRENYGYEREGQAARGRNGRSDLAGSGTGTPGTQPQESEATSGSRRHATPNRSGRSGSRHAPGDAAIDYSKYTTGKYAYLNAQRRTRPDSKDKQ
ncbi:MAG: DnaD domain protein [Chloroflexi bacterium]|uniref:DnaD domain protein n=1 Tax=Candidatus Chlorohelix allophototropha TaxID=3003348 RepID=A0A8T7LXA5_9CHLR|nr:DnaD domain protein [Chloroflexota bacterium]WJW65977.1 DnaD domain protein [Chloroflexota bacterium L227-S17]